MSDPRHVKVLILGGGPAGLTAALYAARAELEPLVLEGGFDEQGRFLQPGGQLMITTDVENFPGFPDGIMGPEIIERLHAQAERFGTEYMQAVATGIDASQRPFRMTVQADEGPTEILADAVIIATGAEAKWLGIEDEKRMINHGVSACATCDGAFFKDVEIGVVGGGDTALEEALFLTRFGSKVHLVHRRDQLRGSRVMAARAKAHPKIEIHWNSVVSGIQGTQASGVTGIVLTDTVTGETSEHPWEALFIAIGHKPNSDMWKDLLDLDEAGYIQTKPGSTYTKIEGVFAAGDVKDSTYRQAVTAAGSGCQAAIDVERWLEAQGAE